MLTKICTKCGIEKDLNLFSTNKMGKLGKSSICKICMSKIAKEWRSNNSERVKEKSKEYYKNNIDNIKEYHKKHYEKNSDRIKEYHREYSSKYRIEHADKVKKASKEYYAEYRIKNADKLKQNKKDYYKENTGKIKEWFKSHGGKIANYDQYAAQIDYAEETRNNNGLLEVKCTYCGRFFQPNNYQVKSRIGGLKGYLSGEHRFYCSTDCKNVCPIYKQRKYEKGKKLSTSREVPAEFRKMALEDRNYTCEKCGSTENGLHVHHINGYSEAPMLAADLCNVLVVCKKCHKEIHKQPGCSYSDYGLCKIG